jgi:hypothetical protein
MRRGEAMALRWSSLDANNVLAVRSDTVDDQGGIIEKLPKTGNRRELLLDEPRPPCGGRVKEPSPPN